MPERLVECWRFPVFHATIGVVSDSLLTRDRVIDLFLVVTTACR